MKILIFEHKNFGIEDICETFNSFGYTYKVISTELIYNRIKTLTRYLKKKSPMDMIVYLPLTTTLLYQLTVTYIIFHIFPMYMTVLLSHYTHVR